MKIRETSLDDVPVSQCSCCYDENFHEGCYRAVVHCPLYDAEKNRSKVSNVFPAVGINQQPRVGKMFLSVLYTESDHSCYHRWQKNFLLGIQPFYE